MYGEINMDMMNVLWQFGIFASIIVFGVKIGLASGLANLSKKLFVIICEHMKFALGENPKWVYGVEQKRAPMTRMGLAAILRRTLYEALDYSEELRAGEADPEKRL